MKYVGVDLHKHLIVLCVVVLEAGRPGCDQTSWRP